MRKAGNLAARLLDYITDFVKEGISTNQLNDLCHEMTIKGGAISAPLNYRGFPKSICTSVNHVICHGVPNDTKLKNGDIVNVDVTVIVDGWYGDSSRTYWVGDVPIKAKRLTQVAYECMMLGIAQVKAGNRLGDIGNAVQTHAEKHNYSVVRDYCGHGIGRVFHTQPNVLHYGKAGTGLLLEEGMFITVEPMVNVGGYETKLNAKDGWTVTTRDRSLSAQFEHTLAVTKDGCEIFTLSPMGRNCPPYK
ncbi:MAG: type I methionyl aminopeptidase [Pseudomonadota bacterium]